MLLHKKVSVKIQLKGMELHLFFGCFRQFFLRRYIFNGTVGCVFLSEKFWVPVRGQHSVKHLISEEFACSHVYLLICLASKIGSISIKSETANSFVVKRSLWTLIALSCPSVPGDFHARAKRSLPRTHFHVKSRERDWFLAREQLKFSGVPLAATCVCVIMKCVCLIAWRSAISHCAAEWFCLFLFELFLFCLLGWNNDGLTSWACKRSLLAGGAFWACYQDYSGD